MKFCRMLVVVGVIGGGCDRGGVLTGSGGAGQPTGLGGRLGTGGRGGSQTIVGTGGAAAGGGTDDFVTACGAVPPAKALPSDILIVLDTSASMNDGFDTPCPPEGCGDQSRWAAAVSAVNAAVGRQSPAVNWGLKFLSTGPDPCETGGVTVPLGPTNAAGLQSALSRRAPGGVLAPQGYTPTRAAIEVAATTLLGRSNAGQHIILLVTDGEPDCGAGAGDGLAVDGAGTVQAILNAASMGFPTFVVGMMIAPGQADATLDEMARAGGLARAGTPAYMPASNPADLFTAMNVLLAETATCTFAVPEPPTSDGTTSRSNIGVMVDGIDAPQDATNGWTYADASQTAIQLNGRACATAGADKTVYVYFHCLLP